MRVTLGLPRIPLALPRVPSALPRIPFALPRIPIALPRIPFVLPRIPIAQSRIPIAQPRIPRWFRMGAAGVVYVFAFLAVGVLLAATLPSFAGFHTVTVYGGSMGKALPAGSVAVTRPVDASDLEVGDVIAMGGHEAGLPILHRIVAIEEVDGGRLVTTRGDANQTNDRLPITVSGKGDRLVYHIPWIGYFLAFSRSALGLALLVGVPASVWVISEVITLTRAIKRRRRRPPASSTAE